MLADSAARAELDALLSSSRQVARGIVTQHAAVVEALRDALLERDELVGSEITDVIDHGFLRSVYFTDPQWTNYPDRFYRIRSP